MNIHIGTSGANVASEHGLAGATGFQKNDAKGFGSQMRRKHDRSTGGQQGCLLRLGDLAGEDHIAGVRFRSQGLERLQRLQDAMGPDLQLYYLFFKADTQTGDKNQAPLKWFEMVVKGIEVVPSVW